ncbi:MAG: hypothetical protein LBB05_02095 [Puniceicoccales bacterium]|jgi:hypothetical protein|nr:hypothetical protein [Puniceicoccales bacterium]
MENYDFIVILGSFQKNTFKIIRSICDFLELGDKVHIPQLGNQLWEPAHVAENLTIKSFDWDNFIEIFQNKSGLDEQKAIVMLSPKTNLAEQFQKLFAFHERFSLNIPKIIAIVDRCYFDGCHENLLDAMAYFSDILLIDNNPEIDRNRLKKFLEHCKQKECYPLLIKVLSQCSVENIPELLDDKSRRMTLIFDDLDPIDLIEGVHSTPFVIPTLAQWDKYLKKDDHGRFCSPVELL